ncbi:Cytochrome P450 [Corchorus olitorius]|uniref:Cytochrome P450 n=1 Tax=Corchorus olitorius TaxID=93759 RepID=A0A1R3FYL8_9ROSI|nr:Cytochrome P450 [Corchorus olitorius]
MLGLYANDVLCRVTFGRDFSQGGDYDRHGFQKMLEDYQELLGGFSTGDFFPSMEFIHSLTSMKSRLQHTFQRFDRFFDQVIDEHLILTDRKRSAARTFWIICLMYREMDQTKLLSPWTMLRP